MIDPREIFIRLPTLHTPRLTLRALALSDAPDIFAYACDHEVCRYTTWNPHTSIDDSRAFLANALGRYEAGQPASWAVVLKSTGMVVGTCGFMEIATVHERGGLGYALARNLWRQGLMCEAVKASIDFGFRVLQLHKIEAHCDVRNIGSARVMERCGMQFEGLMRQHAMLKGERRDVKWYAILRNEWEEALPNRANS